MKEIVLFLEGCPGESLGGILAGWLTGWLAGRLASWLAGWPAGLLAGWPAGLLAGWPAGWPAGWLAGWLVWAGKFPLITDKTKLSLIGRLGVGVCGNVGIAND